MSNWPLLFETALVTGLLLSLVLLVIMFISAAVARDMWVGDYPPDIRAKYGPMSARSAHLRPFFAVLVFGATLLIPLLGLFALQQQVGHLSFIPALVFSALSILVFNLFDLLVLDWLFFCTVQPRIMVLPGTQGMAGYRDYRFHFIGFLKGLGFCGVGGLVIATLWLPVQALAS